MLLKSAGAVAVALASSLLANNTASSVPPVVGTRMDSVRQVLADVLSGRDTTRINRRGANTRRSSSSRIPRGQLPPAGMCRVWIQGVPPGRQPAVTDCASAEAQAATTPNSRVIYGNQQSFPGKGKGKFKSKSNRNSNGTIGRGDNDDDENGVGRGDDDGDDNGVGRGEDDGDEDGVDQRAGQNGGGSITDIIRGRSQAGTQVGATNRSRPSWAGRGQGRGHGRKGD
jgi:hypothetical protein